MEAGIAVSNARPSFRKPSHDTSQRNYRRRSPSRSESPSPSPSPPSPSGGWKRERSSSPPADAQDGVGKGSSKGKKGKTGREEGNGGIVYRGRRDNAPGTSETQNKGSTFDRFRKPDSYESRRSSNYHQERHQVQSGHHSHGEARSHHSRRNADADYPPRNERQSPDRGHRDADRGRDRERERGRSRMKDRERDGEDVSRAKGGGRDSFVDKEIELDGKPDRDWARDRDRSRGKFAGRDSYFDKEMEVERRSDVTRCRDSFRDRDRDREKERSKSKFGGKEGNSGKESHDREIDKGRNSDRDRDRDSMKERGQVHVVDKDHSNFKDWDGETKVYSRVRDKERNRGISKDKAGGGNLSIEKDTDQGRENSRGKVRETVKEKEKIEDKGGCRDANAPDTDMEIVEGRDSEKAGGRDLDLPLGRDDTRGLERRRDREKRSCLDDYRSRDEIRDHDRNKDREEQKDQYRHKSDKEKQEIEIHEGKPSHHKEYRKGRSRQDASVERSLQRDGDKESSTSWDRELVNDKPPIEKLNSVVVHEAGVRPDKDRHHIATASEAEDGITKLHTMDVEARKEIVRATGKGFSDSPGCQSAGPSSMESDSEKRTGVGSDGRLLKGSKWGPESRPSADSLASGSAGEELANDLTAAKLAAMKAAELVNKNLGIPGFMSADQKKKLLWGSKKSATEQEPAVAAGSNRWDTVHFSDPDRQEKFHKLMGVKADSHTDTKKEGETEAGLFTEERQRELQQDLEKQFTAGLRRRDGRTVGLGL